MRHKDPATASKAKALADQIDEVKASGPNEVQLKLTRAERRPAGRSSARSISSSSRTAPPTSATGIGTGPLQAARSSSPACARSSCATTTTGSRASPTSTRSSSSASATRARASTRCCPATCDLDRRGQSALDRPRQATPGLSRSSRRKSGLYTDLIMRKDAGPAQQSRLRAGDEVPVRPRADAQDAVPLGHAVVANDQPIDPTQSLLLRGPAAAARSISDKAKFHLKKSGVGGTPVPVVASPAATVLGRDGAGDAAAGAEDRPEPRRQAHAGRRLLVEPLDEAARSASATSTRARAPTCCSRRSSSPMRLERVGLEEREVRPAAGRGARARPTTPSASRCTPTCR